LTFAQLQTPARVPRCVADDHLNLSHNRPYELPLSQRVWIAKTEEFSGLFPERVLQYLQDHAYGSTATILPEGYFYLPDGDDLPVVMAVRMSLSFPLLISAVPLYTVKRSAFANSPRNEDNAIEVTPADLQRNWFSDGGICSNFPIHFFDTWLPQRPTFGIKLTAFPEGAFDPTTGNLDPDYLGQMRQPDRADQGEAGEVEDEIAPAGNTANQAAQPVDPIYLSPANRAPAPEWTPIEDPAEIGDDGTRPNLLRFLWNIFATAQNYRDNMQSDLPAIEADRAVRLKESEGGLNLAMSPATVARSCEGKLAGRRLLKRFSFEQHQWYASSPLPRASRAPRTK
jgi:predicted acylesterase/phospholipase RssA